jgi:hypothetical protein
MTERSNPLMTRKAELSVQHERGSDAALQQLQQHCARLNAMNTGRYWFIGGEAPERRIDAMPLAVAEQQQRRRAA